jgi:hypothetical protein
VDVRRSTQAATSGETCTHTRAKKVILRVKQLVTIAVLVAAPSALMAQPAPFDLDAHAGPSNVPAWTAEHADRFPACDAYAEGDLVAAVVVVHPDAEVQRMSTDAAWALNTDAERANNVWVIGSCG